ncbi:hypothetical protein D9757_002285 [Collybiopsis confluens]|uniref:Uncharacterized protein n=1 Tax=Collybiopsis confluens TaxID=2823264 RepID=A0A8H5HZU6_9AGAR|nr:hypothetical protein D9757_002285 [Collybiopsis confluens]
MFPSTSTVHHHQLTRRPPLRSSPLTGPALSTDDSCINDSDSDGRPRPCRISSSPDLLSGSSFSSSSVPITPPSTPPPSASRLPSRESLKSLSIPEHKVPPPRALVHPNAHRNGTWLAENTYADTPRFSRLSMSSPAVVMPLQANKYHHRRPSLNSTKSFSHLSLSNPADSEAPTDALSNKVGTLLVQVPLRSKSASTLSLTGGLPNLDSFLASFPSPPEAPYSRTSSKSSCARQEVEIDPTHQRSTSEASSSKSSQRLSTRSRTSGFNSLTSRAKHMLSKSKSLGHSRKTSHNNDCLLSESGTTSYPRHTKDVSFLSFASTPEDLDSMPPVPPLPPNSNSYVPRAERKAPKVCMNTLFTPPPSPTAPEGVTSTIHQFPTSNAVEQPVNPSSSSISSPSPPKPKRNIHPRSSSSKAASVLGMGETEIIIRNKVDIHSNTAIHSPTPPPKDGSLMKKIWKSLTTGKETSLV